MHTVVLDNIHSEYYLHFPDLPTLWFWHESYGIWYILTISWQGPEISWLLEKNANKEFEKVCAAKNTKMVLSKSMLFNAFIFYTITKSVLIVTMGGWAKRIYSVE